ncbi:hypothetical protein MS3_00000308 [Schistosoma haematobium]|uniref:Uncharacterized protein n=1 Tax=Schistosoma haematobium TaxID=6185 RepID=A0A922LIX3_SCHHA|nr:hypothetical protein MS3_00000308 [Schistosoma haematobium]KAH9585833.1 hypothetical protein MS3_00000308 [Schistosoma haematobium]
MTKKAVESYKIVVYFLKFIEKEAYSLLKAFALPEKYISLPYATVKELLLNHVKCTSFVCRERAKFHKIILQNNQKVRESILELQKQAPKCNFGGQIHVQLRGRLISEIDIPGLERELLRILNCFYQDARIVCINYEAMNELDIQSFIFPNSLLSSHSEIHSQDRSNSRFFHSDPYSREKVKVDSTRSCKADHKGDRKFCKCLSCGKFHSRNLCVFRYAKCIKCCKIGHI